MSGPLVFFDTKGDFQNFVYNKFFSIDVVNYRLLNGRSGDRNAEIAFLVQRDGKNGKVKRKRKFRYFTGGIKAAVIPSGISGTKTYAQRLNELLSSDPRNEVLWIQLAETCEGLYEAPKARELRQMDILRKAVSANPFSVELWSRYLHICSRNLSYLDTVDHYEDAFSKCCGHSSIWVQYIAWRASLFNELSVASVRALYQKAITRISKFKKVIKERPAEFDAELTESKIEHHLLVVLQSFVTFELRNGHTEFAIGLCQCMAEVTCFAPDGWEDLWFKRKDEIRYFWESECPRIGEEGAAGWRNSKYTRSSVCKYRSPVHDTQAQYYSTEDGDGDSVITKWLKTEEKRSCEWRPCRACNDRAVYKASPYRCVLYEDIEPYLFPVFEPDMQACLIFLLLECVGVSVFYATRCSEDLLVKTGLEYLCSLKGSPVAKVFDPEMSIQDIFEWKPHTPAGGLDTSRIEFTRNVFRLCCARFPTKIFTMLWLEWEYSLDKDHALKQGMELLQKKENRNDIQMWIIYIQLMKRSGMSAKVLSTYPLIIGQLGNIYEVTPPHLRDDFHYQEVLLRRSYVEHVLFNCIAPCVDNKERVKLLNECIGCLFRVPVVVSDRSEEGKGSVSSVQIIQKADLLSRYVTRELSTGSKEYVYSFLEKLMCYSVLLYLTKSFAEGLAVLKGAAQGTFLSPGTLEHQYLCLLLLRYSFIPVMMKQRAFSPRTLIEITTYVAALYPSHPAVSSLHCRALLKTNLTFKLRQSFEELSYKTRDTLAYIYASFVETYVLPESIGWKEKSVRLLQRGLRRCILSRCAHYLGTTHSTPIPNTRSPRIHLRTVGLQSWS